MNELTPILIEQGILGIVLALAMLWIRSQNKEAKKEREALQEKLFTLIEQTNQFDAQTGHQLSEMRGDLQRIADRIEGRQP